MQHLLTDSVKAVKFRAETLIKETIGNNLRSIINTDRKARIVIIVNVAVISIIVSSASQMPPDENNVKYFPLFFILISNCVCLLLAIRSVGQFRHTPHRDERLKNFIDHNVYLEMPLDAFVRIMQLKLSEKENITTMAIIEMYEQGMLLKKKNTFLSYAFISLGIGLNLAIVGFFIYRIFGS